MLWSVVECCGVLWSGVAPCVQAHGVLVSSVCYMLMRVITCWCMLCCV